MSEKDLILHFFNRHTDATNVVLGIGDDAAITNVPNAHELVTSIDTLVEGIHFPTHTSARDIGYKSIAVSLSDMAAMGATPSTALLSVTLPNADKTWLENFSQGIFELLTEHKVQLIGGDLTKGPLCISSVLNGLVPKGKAIQRSGAKPGNLIFVTGYFGDAGLALREPNNQECQLRLNRPTPRVSTGIQIRDIATAAIDISDGLAIDLEKLCQASNVGANVLVDEVPRRHADIKTALTAGDDYELCFTVPKEKEAALCSLKLDCPIKKIGYVNASKKVDFMQRDNSIFELKEKGYDHF